MNVVFTSHAWAEFEEWLDEDPETAQKIRELIKAIRREPFKGIGKPESLKYSLKGFWSRRITREHRLVYRIAGKKGEGQRVEIIQCKFHYED